MNLANDIFIAIHEINPQIIKIVCSGPIQTPIDAQAFYHHTSCQGILVGSGISFTQYLIYYRMEKACQLLSSSKNQMKEYHFSGIHNYPSMCLVDGTFGMNINSLHLGIDKEIQMIKTAISEGFFTCAMVQTKKQIHAMIKAGVDMLIIYIGLGDSHTASSEKQRRQHIHQLHELTMAARNINPNIPLFFFDECITTIDEVSLIVKEIPHINGYCLLPVTNTGYSDNRLSLEINQLKKLSL